MGENEIFHFYKICFLKFCKNQGVWGFPQQALFRNFTKCKFLKSSILGTSMRCLLISEIGGFQRLLHAGICV